MFVVKKTGATPLSNRAMNYVFSSNEKVGEYWTSPFTKKSIDYVLSTTKINKYTINQIQIHPKMQKKRNIDPFN